MATYTLISSNVLTGSAASVTFSAIPATYTDLVLRTSCRSDGTGGGNSQNALTLNADTATNYSDTFLRGTGSIAQSLADSAVNNTNNRMGTLENHTYTANTFDNCEYYIPNYAGSNKKPISSFGVTENNATASFVVATAGLWQGTAAITSVDIAPYAAAGGFLAGSSFYLYGIKNS
jgi:hypothetical protein